MSDAYLIRQKAPAFATINVTYPAGSILTCTLGTKVLKAKDTTGTWTFAVPKAGTWVVKAVTADGTKTRQRDVVIAVKGEVKAVELAYSKTILSHGAFAGGVRWNGNFEYNGWGKSATSNRPEGTTASCSCSFDMDGYSHIHAYIGTTLAEHSKHWCNVGDSGRIQTTGGWKSGAATGTGSVYLEVYVQSFDNSYANARTYCTDIYID